MTSPGNLYIVATPIGHMDDITIRAINVLGRVRVIAAEDTRNTARLLSHHRIGAPLVSCHEHNEEDRAAELLARLECGEDVALVSDAGTPTLSDPGYRLVRMAVDKGIKVIPIPGPSAAVSALSASGLPTDAFVFVGFLPRKRGKRSEMLEALKRQPMTLIFYESPRRIRALIQEVSIVMGDREAVLCREMTKTHEEFIRGRLSEILAVLSARPDVKGECTFLVAGRGEDDAPSPEVIRCEIEAALAEHGVKLSGISRRLAEKYGVSKNVIYQEALAIKERKQKE
ncbi:MULTISPECIES: 16S rRNA (cytidine(1402)-2'-O)-methyltransferase [Desulfococcus]|uniref:Ribosomal RNA small subunit methyltransferase I n=1 Tax=Desulfococcus multivorans DSM 2059 TaxID=1121405 RepID=S7UK19_DESML|nr:16S rRNA (cytidine(1402)-2'-O)-methyltransferase [Desulfococcus multivorans]AQV03049.1 rRNA (cytidine-2'-O-)-methyltransferase [Desulfococcus multivorans]EPR34154.1 Ribosomal RNA small subunit methyltransferase I [Desulfococcus multivorans DSM 2059]SKA19512.1 16S rRNA (cytidine1402-2'-O)-methyltransferase [Desulfococcus multivorans DSM 2059]